MANNRRKSDLPRATTNQRLDESGDLPQGRLDQRQGDLEPGGVNPRIQGGPEARGGMAGPGIAGSGTHGLQDDVNQGGPIGQSGKPAPTMGMNKSSGSKK
jgi:hypothetical protein